MFFGLRFFTDPSEGTTIYVCCHKHPVSVAPMPMPSLRFAFASFGLVALAACGGHAASTPNYQQELFTTGASPFAHNFDATVGETCEAARRTLLSQGFLTTMAQSDTVDATKNFQPSSETHVVVSFHVVCTPAENTANQSIAYVNAVQDSYAPKKKSDTSASGGLSVLARFAVAADPLEQRRDGEDLQRNRAGRQVL